MENKHNSEVTPLRCKIRHCREAKLHNLAASWGGRTLRPLACPHTHNRRRTLGRSTSHKKCGMTHKSNTNNYYTASTPNTPKRQQSSSVLRTHNKAAPVQSHQRRAPTLRCKIRHCREAKSHNLAASWGGRTLRPQACPHTHNRRRTLGRSTSHKKCGMTHESNTNNYYTASTPNTPKRQQSSSMLRKHNKAAPVQSHQRRAPTQKADQTAMHKEIVCGAVPAGKQS